MCCAVWCVGLCVYAYRGFPKFEPLAMLGGALWCTGNALAVPIINMLGLALGMSVWCVANMATGWASGVFGILGVEKQAVAQPVLNYVGAAVAASSIVLFTFVQNSPSSESSSESSNSDGNDSTETVGEGEALIGKPMEFQEGDTAAQEAENAREAGAGNAPDGMARCIARMSPGARRAVGFVLALVSGVFYGTNFNPPQYRIDHGPAGTSREVLDYVFPHFTGIFAMSTLILALYCAAARNRPVVYRNSLLPGLASGAIWAVAQVSWFVANKNLSFPVSFPIITSGPAVVASLWGVLLFHEVSGTRQLVKMAIALLVTVTGVVLITLSKLLKK